MYSTQSIPMNPTPARLVRLIARRSQGFIADYMRPLGLTAAEQPFFMALLHNEGVSQEQLTTLVGVDKSATARAVKSLEEKGFLTRRQDEDDRRQNRLFPTAKAQALYPEVRSALDRFNALLTTGITPEELALLRRLFLKMEDNLNRRKESDSHV